MYDDLFFHHPLWLFGYNLLHSPLILILAWGLLEFFGRHSKKSPGVDVNSLLVCIPKFRGFLIACAIHSVIDILTHHDDGPLLFYPLSVSLRFFSPVSYWDVDYYARPFFVFEMSVNVLCILYLVSQRKNESKGLL